MMKKVLLTGTVLATLALPHAASARVIELGSEIPVAQVSCPANCQAIGRVTGYQGRGGAVRDPFVIPRAGTILAFTIRLGQPDATQERFFDDLYGGPPQARISILRQGRKKKKVHRLLAQSPAFRLDPYFGTSPTFLLDKPIRVRRKQIVAITVPTWAPAFAVGLQRDHWWRSSRAAKRCENVKQTAQQTKVASRKTYGCTYFTARLYYTVTYVPDNRETRKVDAGAN
jgi:hypothetical protein